MRFVSLLACSLLLFTPAASSGQVLEFPDDRTLTLDDIEALAVPRNGRMQAIIDDMIFDIDSLRNVDPKTRLWPNGTLIYEFDPDINQAKRNVFLSACAVWSNIANVRCQERTSETAFALVRSANKNSATVGMTGAEQEINIFNWNNLFIIVHELGHAFGFVHEHQRIDRDAHVIIHWENIEDGKLHNFYKLPSINYTVYDYSSVMHYDGDSFSKNGNSTITAQYPAWASEMGQRTHLSLRDQIEFKLAYGEHSTNFTIRVRDMKDVNYYNSKAFLYNTPNVGYEINVIEGPAFEEDLSIDACQTVIVEPLIYYQALPSGTRVRVGTTVDVKTYPKKYVAFDYGQPGCN